MTERAAPDPAEAAPEIFSPLQVGLHWTIAGLILLQMLLHQGMEVAFADRMDGRGAGWTLAALVHVTTGAAVLALTLWRLVIRWQIGVPPPEADASLFVRLASKATHLALYALAIGMPLTGAAAWFGQSELAAELHELGRPLLVAVVALHILGALFEHAVMGNDTLARMLRSGGRAGSTTGEGDGEAG